MATTPAVRITSICSTDPGWQLGPKHHRLIALAVIENVDGRQRTACLIIKDGRPQLVEAEALHHFHDSRRKK